MFEYGSSHRLWFTLSDELIVDKKHQSVGDTHFEVFHGSSPVFLLGCGCGGGGLRLHISGSVPESNFSLSKTSLCGWCQSQRPMGGGGCASDYQQEKALCVVIHIRGAAPPPPPKLSPVNFGRTRTTDDWGGVTTAVSQKLHFTSRV